MLIGGQISLIMCLMFIALITYHYDLISYVDHVLDPKLVMS